MENRGYDILDRNWKTRVCEIDIVAKKNGIVFFVEVKYRRQNYQGDGFEYITGHKLHKMNFAAEIWRQHNRWEGDYRLMAAAVSGQGSESIELIEII